MTGAADPYEVLGVAKGAADDDIRRAYRKLAKELHPDLNPSDSKAAERFQKVSAAYDILGDPPKRRQFDLGQIDASGEPRRNFHYARNGARSDAASSRPGGAGRYAFSDIFEDVVFKYRNERPDWKSSFRSGQDVRYTLEVDFLEAVTGVRKRVTLPEGGVLDLTVPEGVRDQQVLRLKGRGNSSPGGGEPGDALVEIKVRAHPNFKRVDDDIHVEVPITLDEAVLGGKIEVATVSGRVNLSLPKATSSGRVFRLREQGVKNVSTGEKGDQLVTVRIVMPKEVDDELAYFFNVWRQDNSYDPGNR